jgi:hypothetical protein
MLRTRIDWFVVVLALALSYGCGGGCGGCDGMEPIPGGFPANKRTANAVQVRVTQGAIAEITRDPAAVIGPLVGNANNGIIEFDIPPSCGGDPRVCCPNGQPQSPCGPLEIDLVKRATDPDERLIVTPVGGQSRIDMTIRARVKTKMPLPIRYSGINCTVSIDTTRDNNPPDLRIDVQIQFSQDPAAETTRIAAQNVTVSQLESGDVTLGGGILCAFGGAFIGAFLGTLQNQIASQIQNTINDEVCRQCPSGDVAECGSSFATACTNRVCMIDNRCLQSLGIDGRLRGSLLFASLSPGTTGALDLYEVAGGYATTEQMGVALGLLGGMQPGGAPRDRCGPPATEPASITITPSAYFQGNTRPDTNDPFHVGIGIHKSQLAELAFAGYDGGLFCLTIGASTVAQLSTDTMSLLSRSLGRLVEDNSPMAIGLRPQAPPTITLGKNTFADDGNGNTSLVEPLLDIFFQALEIDFFAAVDDQYIRVFTVVSDVHLPIGLQVTGMGQLAPVIGSPEDAFTNISVKHSEAITESPAELANLFPTLLSLVLPQLSGGLSPISLPELGGLALTVTDVTAVDNDDYLAIFADLVPATMARTVQTTAELTSVVEPPDAIARDVKRWHEHAPPTVTLALGGDAADLEFSYRTNGGTWSAWSTNPRPAIAPKAFWLPGVHVIDVRARQQGRPETMDPTPERIEVALGTGVPVASGGMVARSAFHGQAGSSGCSCETTGSAAGGLPLVLALGLLAWPRRSRRRVRQLARALGRGAARLGPLVWLAAIASLPGCNCGNPCGDADCLPGEVERGPIGRWTSIAADEQRVLVATYDQKLGDVVVVDATDRGNLRYVAVDGIPQDTPTHDPSTYRGGVVDPGPNVGAWTTIALGEGIGRVAYQDRDERQLRYAYETSPNRWASHEVDWAPGEDVGVHAAMVMDADGRPVIAYLALGVDDGQGRRMTELRLARAGIKVPKATADWNRSVIVTAPGTCAGLCDGQTCVAGDPPTCVSPTTDCSGSCGDGRACVGGVCRDVIPEPTMLDLPTGTGLFVSLVVLPDGRLAAAYYDRTRRALVLAVENARGTSMFTETVLDGDRVGADRGMWASAAVGGDGTVHVAYQDALGDQLVYTTWNGAPGTPEIVDDGQRTGDRTHPVGAAASIYLVAGSPAIAYQDGLTSDVYLATRGGTWTTTSIASGPLLDGFFIAATTFKGAPVLAWGQIDPARTPIHGLVVTAP